MRERYKLVNWELGPNKDRTLGPEKGEGTDMRNLELWGKEGKPPQSVGTAGKRGTWRGTVANQRRLGRVRERGRTDGGKDPRGLGARDKDKDKDRARGLGRRTGQSLATVESVV